MSIIDTGVLLAVLGAYIFIFKVSNELNHQVDDLKIQVTDRLARVEEQLKTIFRYMNRE